MNLAHYFSSYLYVGVIHDIVIKSCIFSCFYIFPDEFLISSYGVIRKSDGLILFIYFGIAGREASAQLQIVNLKYWVDM